MFNCAVHASFSVCFLLHRYLLYRLYTLIVEGYIQKYKFLFWVVGIAVLINEFTDTELMVK